MRIEGIKTGPYKGILLILMSQFVDGYCKTYMLVDVKSCVGFHGGWMAKTNNIV